MKFRQRYSRTAPSVIQKQDFIQLHERSEEDIVGIVLRLVVTGEARARRVPT